MDFNDGNNSSTVSYKTHEPRVSRVVGIYISLIILVSVVSNSLVIAVICSQKKRHHRPTHIFIVALAVSDILCSVLVHPMLVATSFGLSSDDIFGTYGCDFYGFGILFFASFSMIIHGTISFARYRITVSPPNNFWQKPLFSLCLLIFNVMYALVFALAPVLGWGRFETFEYGCTVAFHDKSPLMRSYVISLLVAVLGIPLLLCISCYSMIVYSSYKCKVQLFTLKSDKVRRPSTAKSSIHSLEDVDGIILSQKELPLESMSVLDKKWTQVTLITCCGFLFAWAPYAVLAIWEMVRAPTEIPSAYRIAAALFCKSATAYNPIIYFYKSAAFRHDFGELVTSACCSVANRDKADSKETSVTAMQPNSHPRLSRSSELRRVIRTRSKNSSGRNSSSYSRCRDNSCSTTTAGISFKDEPTTSEELCKSPTEVMQPMLLAKPTLYRTQSNTVTTASMRRLRLQQQHNHHRSLSSSSPRSRPRHLEMSLSMDFDDNVFSSTHSSSTHRMLPKFRVGSSSLSEHN